MQKAITECSNTRQCHNGIPISSAHCNYESSSIYGTYKRNFAFESSLPCSRYFYPNFNWRTQTFHFTGCRKRVVLASLWDFWIQHRMSSQRGFEEIGRQGTSRSPRAHFLPALTKPHSHFSSEHILFLNSSSSSAGCSLKQSPFFHQANPLDLKLLFKLFSHPWT